MNESKELEDAAGRLFDKVSPLIGEIKKLQDQAKALGIFVGNRPLCECLDCHLFENVNFSGELFVYYDKNYNDDTGLRFKELEESAMSCPQCGIVFCPYDPDY